MKSKIGILGSGVVAQTLGLGFINAGYQVCLGTGHLEKLSEWQAKAGAAASVSSFEGAAAFGDILVLALKGHTALQVLTGVGAGPLAGKTIMDATNPIADAPPKNGVLSFFTPQNGSLMGQLQAAYPEAHFVKAFNSVGAPLMVNPDFGGTKPSMFICGDDAAAKADVTAICTLFGFDTEDMGGQEAAGAIEALCILWCIPGFQNGDWLNHAFKLLKR